MFLYILNGKLKFILRIEYFCLVTLIAETYEL